MTLWEGQNFTVEEGIDALSRAALTPAWKCTGWQPTGDIPKGLCQCGCGARTSLTTRTDRRIGYVKDEPRRFLRGHSGFKYSRDDRPDYTVDPETGCWVWAKHCNPQGYGRIRVAGKALQAHRWIYEQQVGPIPEGLTLDHLCRNRACVNPEHLEPVTNAENLRRGIKTRLSPVDVRAIRNSSETHACLAERYSVRADSIAAIRRRRWWKDIA